VLQATDDADGLVAMERQHLLQLKKSMETEMGLIQQQLKVISFFFRQIRDSVIVINYNLSKNPN